MSKTIITDEEVETEIKRLLDTDAVKLARKEQQIKYRRRQYLYQLRCMKKHGEDLMASGITLDNIEEVAFATED